MTIEETKVLMQKIQLHYWRSYKDMPKNYMASTIKEWHRFLEKFAPEDISAALDLHISQCPFPPGIAEVKLQLKVVFDQRARTKLAEVSALPPPVDPLSQEETKERIRQAKEKLRAM